MQWIERIGHIGIHPAALAALHAGVDLGSILVPRYYAEEDYGELGELPFYIAAFLCSTQDQWALRKRFFRRGSWKPSGLENRLASRFCKKDEGRWRLRTKLSVDAIRDGAEIGIDLRYVTTRCYIRSWHYGTERHVTLLSLAILFAQSDCTVELSNAGVGLTHEMEEGGFRSWLMDYFHCSDEVPRNDAMCPWGFVPAPPSQCRSVAVAAVQVLLQAASRRAAAEKGVAVYQVMRKMLGGRPFPMVVVNNILTLAAEVPSLIEELDLWDLMGNWSTSIFWYPSDSAGAANLVAESVHPEGSDMDHEPQPTPEDTAGSLPFQWFAVVSRETPFWCASVCCLGPSTTDDYKDTTKIFALLRGHGCFTWL